ncbi:uncharacterized protein LOC119177342 [Rhipicephalus microplus]|uniref:uncharacterized protein LOC119177342 n=1 Tax=Rhipicephalus microplus TaxID=6941 RepID=UPI003F6D0D2F
MASIRWASPSGVRKARRSNRLSLAPQRRLASGRQRVRAKSRRWSSSRASSGGGPETSSLAVASAELAAGGRVVAAVSVPVGSGWAAHGAAEAAQSPSVGASSPGPAISGGGDSPSSLNRARSRLAGPSRELAAVEGMAGLTWSDQETYELIRIWAADRDLLDGTSRNNKVYESMAAQMRSLGYLRTALQVKEKMKRLRKEYKYGKRSKKIATYHDALATVLAQGSKGGSLFIKSEVDESMGSEEFPGTDSETNYMEDGPGCSAPPAEGNGNDERAQGFFRAGGGGSTGGGVAQGLDYSRSPSSPPVECATALRFPADNFPTITTTTAEPGDGARFPAAGAGGPRASLKRKLPDAPSPPTLAASTLTDLITRGIDKFVELEHKRMRLELDLLERLRHEELERLERMRREEMDHELRLMSVLASLFNNNNSTSSVNLNSSSSEPPAGS